jgi:hypothetical protein
MTDLFGIGAGLALLSVSGAIPRLGIMRAFTLRWKNCIMKINPLSVRKSEIGLLNNSIQFMEKGSYIIVTGEKGNGKTCLIDTTLNQQYGVVKISVRYSFVFLYYFL